MKARLLLAYLFFIGHVACSQQNVIIQKKCFSVATESFPAKSYICQKIFFSGQILIYKVDYSYNGWQIIDSVAYQKEGLKYCSKSYQPVYDFENRTIKSYQLLYVDCNQVKVSSNDKFPKINDKYGLSREYLYELELLISKNPERNAGGYKFNGGIIPTIFGQYGIPYDETLYAFTFSIKNSVVKEDSFTYEHFILNRSYQYENGFLKEVKIVIKDGEERTISQFREVFELEQ